MTREARGAGGLTGGRRSSAATARWAANRRRGARPTALAGRAQRRRQGGERVFCAENRRG